MYAWDTVAHEKQIHQIPLLNEQQASSLVDLLLFYGIEASKHWGIGANLYLLPLLVTCFPSLQQASSFPKDKPQSDEELGAGAKQAS